MTSRIASDHQIQLRRKQEAQLAVAKGGVQQDRVLRHYAKWEITTHAKIQKNGLMRDMDRVQARHDETLEQRRKRLAELLAREQEEYDAMLEGMAETQEQRRDRIAKQAVELRNERERLRKDFAEQQRERIFRNNCAQLREADSKAVNLQVAAERQQQLDWNSTSKVAAREEEAVYDELWEEERLKKERRARADLERQREMNEHLRRNLDVQRETHSRERQRAIEQEQQENDEFRKQLQRDIEEDARKERERRLHMMELGRQNKQFNIELETQKSEEKRKELEEDKRFLTDLLEKVKEDEEHERQFKKKMREDAVAHMKEVEKQMMNAAGAETELDRLWQIESDKEWAKREARWAAQQAASDKLLRDTYEARAEQIRQKREDKRAQTLANMEEKEKMMKDIERMQAEEREAARNRYMKAKMNQTCLLDQKKQKEEAAAAERRGRDLEMVAAQMAEMEFQAKVKQEIDKLEERKPEQFKHLSLTKRTF